MTDIATLAIKVDSTKVATASKDLNDLEEKSRKVERATDSVSKSFNSLKATLAGLATYLSIREIVQFSSSLFEAGKSVERLNKAYQEIQGSAAKADKEFKFLRESADKLGQNFYVLAEQYKSISAASKGTALEGQNTRDIFIAVTKAASSLGLSADGLSGSLNAIQQMMSKGKVSAEELRQQLGERLPGAFNLMAKAMGVSTSKLDDMLQKGEVLAADALPKLAKVLSEKYSGAVDEATRASNKFAEAWMDLKVEMARSGFLESITRSIKNVTEALKDPEVQRSLKEFAANLGLIIERLAQLAKFAGLRSVSETNAQAAELASQGLLSMIEYSRLGFVERQRVVDDILAKQKQINTMSYKIGPETKGYAGYAKDGLADDKALAASLAATAAAEKEAKAQELAAKAAKKAAKAAAAAAKEKEDAIVKYIAALKLEVEQIGLDDVAKEKLIARQKGITGARLEEVDALISQKKAQEDLWKAAKEADEAMAENIQDGINKAVQWEAERKREADQLLQDKMTLYENLAGFEDEYREAQIEWIGRIRDEEIKAGLDKEAANKKYYASIKKLEQDLLSEKIRATARGFGDLSNALSDISYQYAEGSKEAENWQAAADAMMIAQKSLAVVDAVAAVASASTAPFPAGFVAGAAMAAAMGSLLATIGESIGGFGGGGSSSSAPSTPTSTNYSGTVLGDITASSESIANVTDVLMDIHSDEYPELQRIRQEMVELNNNITGLVSSILRGSSFDGTITSSDPIRSSITGFMENVSEGFYKIFDVFGDQLGGFLKGFDVLTNSVTGIFTKYLGGVVSNIVGGSTKTWNTAAGFQLSDTSIGSLLAGGGIDVNTYADYRTKKSGGWFGKTKWYDSSVTGEASADIQRLFDQVFTGLSDSMLSLGESLGTPIDKVKEFVFEIGKIDLKDLTGDEINQKLQDVISTAADNAAQSIFSGIEQYQQIGEGLYETAVRLVTDKEIILSSLDAIGLGFTGVANSMDAVAFSESLLGFADDLDTLTSNISSYFSNFLTEQEQFYWTSGQLAKSVENLNLALPMTRDGFKDMVAGLDRTTDSGKRAFVSLMSLADAADEYYAYVEKAEKDRYDKEIALIQDAQREAQDAMNATKKAAEDASKAIGDFNRTAWQKSITLQNTLTESIMTMGMSDTDQQLYSAKTKMLDFTSQIVSMVANQEISISKAIELGRLTKEWFDKTTDGILKNAALQEAQNNVAWLQEQISQLENKVAESKQTYIDALNDEISAIQEAQDALKTAFDNARSVYQSALNDEIARLSDAQATLESNAATAKQNYIDAIRREIEAIGGAAETTEDMAGKWASLSKSLREVWEGLFTGAISPLNAGQKASSLGGQFRSSVQAGFAGNYDEAAKAGGLATEYLSAVRASTADRFEYAKIFAQVQAQVATLADVADTRGTPEEQTAANTGRTVEELQALLDSLVPPAQSLSQAAKEYYEADKALNESNFKSQIETLETELAKISDPVLTLQEASVAYYEAKTALDASVFQFEIDKYKIELEQFDTKIDLDEARNQYLTDLHNLQASNFSVELLYWQRELNALSGITAGISRLATLAYASSKTGYADGGISYGPQLAMVSEGTYPVEAHVPLPNGKSIPVEIRGGSGPDDETKSLLKQLISLVKDDKKTNGRVLDVLESVVVGQRSMATRAA